MKEIYSVKTITYSSLVAIGFASLLLFTVILPAEYGYDPLGTGKKFGLVTLSKNHTSALETQDSNMHQDNIILKLFAFESVEYKYYLHAGDILIYDWQSSGEVLYDMHGDPNKGSGLNEASYAKGRSTNRQGVYRATFTGIHGWWWQNRGSEEVSIRLRASGFYTYAKEMRDGLNHRYDFNDE